MRKRRKITIELPSDFDQDRYADLAHAAWMLLKVAGISDVAAVRADTDDPNDSLTARWRQYEIEAPWQP